MLDRLSTNWVASTKWGTGRYHRTSTIGSIDRLRLSTLRTAMAITVSDAGLGLYAFVFTALSIVVRGVFDACNVANLPPIAEAGLTREDCEQWSQSCC